MRLLVTRPAPSHIQTISALSDAGHEALHMPVMQLVPLHFDGFAGKVDALIATSAHMFLFLDFNAVAGLLERPLAVVGERTAEAARAFGFRNIVLVCEDAKTLLATLPKVFSQGTYILYLCARERSTDFAQLGAAYPITLMPVYGADAVDAIPDAIETALRLSALDGVLHYSRRSAALFMALLQQHGLSEVLHGLQHFCLAEKVAEPLVHAGYTSIHIAAAPTEKALMETISAL